MIVLEGVSYRHAGARQPALHDINISIGDGEIVCIAGANESGKTTLCLVLAGLAPRVIGGTLGGRVVLDAADAAPLQMYEFVERVGIVFDDPSTQLSGVTGTVYEEVAFGPSNLGLSRDEVLERTEEALDAVAITHLAGRDPARLSGGQQQLVAVASILAMRPRHLVLDEPTAQLDPSGTELVASAITGLAGRGVSIVLVEHKTDVIARVGGRLVVLDEGRIVLEGPTDEVFADSRLTGFGVSEPSFVRIRRRLTESGHDPNILDSVGAR